MTPPDARGTTATADPVADAGEDAGAGGPAAVSGVAVALWSALGLAAAFALAVDKIKMLQDPDFVPSCNFNPVLSCGSVITTDQASVFGFPNPFLGLVGFAVITTLGVLVAARVRLPGAIFVGATAGSFLGFLFVHWLAFQSLYRIGALCPWCLVVWVVSPLLLIWTGSWAAATSRSSTVRALGSFVWNWRYPLAAAWYLLVVVLILIRFWPYWSTLL